MGNFLQIGLHLESNKFSPFYVRPENFENVPIEGFQNGLKRREGVLLPTYVRNIDIVRKLNIKKNDAIVVGFPKSGSCRIQFEQE